MANVDDISYAAGSGYAQYANAARQYILESVRFWRMPFTGNELRFKIFSKNTSKIHLRIGILCLLIYKINTKKNIQNGRPNLRFLSEPPEMPDFVNTWHLWRIYKTFTQYLQDIRKTNNLQHCFAVFVIVCKYFQSGFEFVNPN